jgi:hypothetical protein
MAQQSINIGTTANDGTGDPIRTAFDKTNQNFTELYGVLGANGIANAVIGLTANSANFVGAIPASNVVTTSALSSYQTTAGLSANVAALSANNANNLGGVAAASYVQNTDSRTLSGNVNFTGTNVVFQANTVKIGGSSNTGANGSVWLPNGIKLNWGQLTVNTTSVATYSNDFPTATLSVTVTPMSNALVGANGVYVSAVNTSAAEIRCDSPTSTGNAYYLAIGF